MDIAFPYGFDRLGRTATSDLPTHVRDMIEQVLLAGPGERVNRPGFGSGTGQLVFAPNSDTLAAAQRQLIQAGLQQFLADVIQVQSVEVSSEEATLTVTVRYLLLETQEPQSAELVIAGGAT
jgi:phage baseplate assembly protein W